MAYKKPPSFQRLALPKLFVDAVESKVFAGNVERPHGREGEGYQRNPYVRMRWIEARVEIFDPKLCRPLEVSDREDGTYAIIDGGGRWLLSQLAKRTDTDCRVHFGLSREAEADLFYKFDREIYRLRAVDTYLAALAAGHETINEIHGAISKSYAISKRGGASSFDGVGTLYDIYHCPGGGTDLIERTGFLCANEWGGRKKDKETGKDVYGGERVPGMYFGAVAVVLGAGRRIEPALRLAMRHKLFKPSTLAKKIKALDAEWTTAQRIGWIAAKLAKHANSQAAESQKIDPAEVRESDLLDAFAERKGGKLAFSGRLRADEDESDVG